LIASFEKLNYDVFPQLVLWLGQDIELFEKDIWVNLEKYIWDNMQFFSFD